MHVRVSVKRLGSWATMFLLILSFFMLRLQLSGHRRSLNCAVLCYIEMLLQKIRPFFFLLFSLIVAIAESGVICTTGLCEQEHTLQGACWIRNWGLGLQRPQKQTSPIIRINLGPKTVSYCYYWRVEGNPHIFYELILGTMVALSVYDQITYFNYTSFPSWDLEIIMKNFYIHRCIFPQEIPTSAKKQIIPRPTHPGNVRPDSVINSIKEK